MQESRQVKRARERSLKKNSKPATHKVYYIPFKRKSRNGVEYTYYKKVVDVIGLDKKQDDRSTIKNTVDKRES